MHIMKSFFIRPCILLSLLLIVSLQACTSDDGYVDSTVYVSITDHTHKYAPRAKAEVPIDVQAFGKKDWEGEVSLMLKQKDSILLTQKASVSVEVDSTTSVNINLALPEPEGTYELVAQIEGHEGQPVKSRRLIEIERPIEWDLDTMKLDINL